MRPERHVPNSIATIRRRLSAALAKTLSRCPCCSRLTKKDFAAADPDHDGTLSKDEYLAVVEQRFNAANTDNDGTIDDKELRSKQGRALLGLMQ